MHKSNSSAVEIVRGKPITPGRVSPIDPAKEMDAAARIASASIDNLVAKCFGTWIGEAKK